MHRVARARAVFTPRELSRRLDDPEEGARVLQGILSAWRFASQDPFRAATHNKGIMNGVDAIAIATGKSQVFASNPPDQIPDSLNSRWKLPCYSRNQGAYEVMTRHNYRLLPSELRSRCLLESHTGSVP